MTEIEINDKKYTAPSKWAELSQEQLIIWMKVCEKKISASMALMFVSVVFSGIKKNLHFKLNVAQQIALSESFNFLLENKLTAWIIPTIKIGFKTFLGPSDYFSTSTIEEFSTAETYYHAYLKNKDEALLDLLIATLYRPASSINNGKDTRKVFAEVDVLRNARKMSKLDKHLRAAILFNYEGCRLSVMQRYPTLFIQGDGAADPARLPDLSPIIKTIAGGKFGTYKQTKMEDLYVFLNHWRDEQEAWEKQKQEANRK